MLKKAGSRVVGAQAEKRKVAREPVQKFEVAQARRCARRAVAIQISEEAVDVIGAELRDRDVVACQIAMKAGEHRAMLNDGALGKRPPGRAGGLCALPLTVSRLWI